MEAGVAAVVTPSVVRVAVVAEAEVDGTEARDGIIQTAPTAAHDTSATTEVRRNPIPGPDKPNCCSDAQRAMMCRWTAVLRGQNEHTHAVADGDKIETRVDREVNIQKRQETECLQQCGGR